MNIIYIFDNNYADISGVSIYSLLKNNQDEETIHIYIVDGGISIDNKDKLTRTVKKFSRQITFLNAPDPEDVFQLKLNTANWCKTNYIRLYLEYILPIEIERVLYIDSDTYIRHSLNKLYYLDMHEFPIAAAYDCSPLPKYQLGLTINDKYYSDGVLLLDLKKLRQKNYLDMYKDFLKEQNGNVPYLEQGAINYVMNNLVYLLPSPNNIMTLSLLYKKNPTIFFLDCEPYYTKSEIMNAINDPVIVHLTGHPLCLRPWFKNSNHDYTKEWRDILKETEWKNMTFKKLKHHFLYCPIISILKYLLRYKTISRLFALHSARMENINKYRQQMCHANSQGTL